jgi:activating signal cointegrator complex subunit 3
LLNGRPFFSPVVVVRSAENMLVCAPTGAGKTNVAMLALLQLVGQHVEGGVLDRSTLKAVYIAPMKALVQEVQARARHAKDAHAETRRQ